MNNQAYCLQCGAFVDFTTEQIHREMDYEGVRLRFSYPQANCAICGNAVSYAPYDELASEAFSDALRKEKGIVSLEIVKELPEKYGIGKRPLSNLLGWGELTYTRFVDGSIPSKPYSETIEELYDDPRRYLELLNKNKGKITDVAYRKSLDKTRGILGFTSSNDRRLLDFAEAFIVIARGDIYATALQKLLYYVQSFGQVFGVPTFESRPRAWVKGPVYGKVWHLLENVDLNEYYQDTLSDSFPSILEDAGTRSLIKSVFLAFGQYSSFALSGMTHIEEPWIKARERAGAVEGQRCSEQIRIDDQEKYFKRMASQLKINSIEDISKYSQYIYDKSLFGNDLQI